MKKLKSIFALGLIIFSLSVYQIYRWSTCAGPLLESKNVVIGKGVGFGQVTYHLNKSGVISKPRLFKILARVLGVDKSVHTGEYVFEAGISMIDVLDKIASGDVYYRKLTLAEGLTTREFIEKINEAQGLKGEITIEVKEGELLPETYSYQYGDSKDSVILQAKKAMEKSLNDVWELKDVDLPIKTKEELLILASIIEKETGLADERKKVASVFVNRLRKRMKLQTDPTVIYAITNGKFELNRSLRKKDLNIKSKYNTYVNYGLPIGPICNPGIDSIKAAANPEVTDFYYFVADGEGGHRFSKTLDEHNNNVKKWIKSINAK